MKQKTINEKSCYQKPTLKEFKISMEYRVCQGSPLPDYLNGGIINDDFSS